MGPYTIEELFAFIESGEYDRLAAELERNDGIEPDAACARSLEEGLNMETLTSPRGLMQWIMCRAHQIRREDGWQMDAALRRAWEEAEVAGDRLSAALPEDIRRRTPDDITEFKPRDELPEWFESDGGSDEDRIDFRPEDIIAGWQLTQTAPTRLVYSCPERFTLSAGATASEVDVRRVGDHWEARLSEFKDDGEELPFGGEDIERDATSAREAYDAAREWMLNHPCESQMDVEQWQIDRFENEAAELSYDVESYDKQRTVTCEQLIDDWRKAAGLLLVYADLPRVNAVTTGLSYIDWCSGQIRERAGMQGCLPAHHASNAHSYIEQACDALGVDADETRELAKQALAQLDASNVDYEGHGDRRAERQDFSQFGGAGRGRPQSVYGAKFDPENPRRHEAFEDARHTVRVFGPEKYLEVIENIAEALDRGETPYIARDADIAWTELRSAIDYFGIGLLIDAMFTEEGDPERIVGQTREEWKREFNAFEQDEYDELITPEPPADLPESVNGWELVGTARGSVLYEGGASVRRDGYNIYLEIHRVPDKSTATSSSKFAVWTSPWGAERTLRKGPAEDATKAVSVIYGEDTFEAAIDAAIDYMRAVPPRDANYFGENDPRFDLTEEQTMRAAHYALGELLSVFNDDSSRVRHAFENRPQHLGFSQTRGSADALTDAVVRGEERLPVERRKDPQTDIYWEAHAILTWVAEEYPDIFDDALDHTRDRYGFDESRGDWRDTLSPDAPDEDLGRYGAAGREPERKERRSQQRRESPGRGQRSLDDILSGGIGGDVGPSRGRLSEEERERRRKRREERQQRHDERRDRETQQGTLTGDTTSDADRERREKEEESRRRERERQEEGLDKWAARTGTPERIIALVGCGNAKFPGRLPAKDKYSSHYYAKKRAYAERNSDEWYILSAKYGLTPPEQPIDDYDLAISELSPDERRVWGEQVIQALGDIEDAHIIVLAGRDYLDPIEDALAERAMSVETPLAGMGIGEQTSWLKSKVGPVTAPSEPPEPEPDIDAEDVVDELERGESEADTTDTTDAAADAQAVNAQAKADATFPETVGAYKRDPRKEETFGNGIGRIHWVASDFGEAERGGQRRVFERAVTVWPSYSKTDSWHASYRDYYDFHENSPAGNSGRIAWKASSIEEAIAAAVEYMEQNPPKGTQAGFDSFGGDQ